MSEQPKDDRELLNFIAVTVETMRGEMGALRGEMATKRDLEGLATKDEVESLRGEVSFIAGQVETLRDQMATKGDVSRLESKMDAGFTALRGDVEQTHLRLDSIERAVSSRVDHIETELSRLRSVLYLLVKDKPEMLRLLGQTPNPGARAASKKPPVPRPSHRPRVPLPRSGTPRGQDCGLK